jgi:hypothetical protein
MKAIVKNGVFQQTESKILIAYLKDACVQELEDDVESKLTGRFRQVILGLLDLPLVYYAKELFRAIEVCSMHLFPRTIKKLRENFETADNPLKF